MDETQSEAADDDFDIDDLLGKAPQTSKALKKMSLMLIAYSMKRQKLQPQIPMKAMSTSMS